MRFSILDLLHLAKLFTGALFCSAILITCSTKLTVQKYGTDKAMRHSDLSNRLPLSILLLSGSFLAHHLSTALIDTVNVVPSSVLKNDIKYIVFSCAFFVFSLHWYITARKQGTTRLKQRRCNNKPSRAFFIIKMRNHRPIVSGFAH